MRLSQRLGTHPLPERRSRRIGSKPSDSRICRIAPATLGSAIGGDEVRAPLITPGWARSRSLVGLARSSTTLKSSTGPASALGSIANNPSSSNLTSDSIGSAPRMPSVWTNPASDRDVLSIRLKRLRAIRGPASSLATSASTAAGRSRCSVISSALPNGRMRVSPGGRLAPAGSPPGEPLCNGQARS